jgi:CRP-like cAMP-binding protein
VVAVETLRKNKLLGSVSHAVLDAIGVSARALPLTLKQQIYEARTPIRQVWFPVDCVISLIVAPDGDDPIEVGTVGNEGMVGITVLLGSETSEETATTQIPGTAIVVETSAFLRCIRENDRFARRLYRYTAALLAFASLTAACNRVHTLPERCARWLLLTHDRVDSDSFPLTQEFMAQMLGARRPTISVVASNLQEEGLIRYVRGVITIVDRAGLEAATCSCYHLQRENYARLLERSAESRS